MAEKVWNYGGASFTLDMDDVETAERYEAAFQKMQAQFAEPDGTSEAAKLREYCEAIRFLLDDLFGEGTAQKLLGEKLNIAACDDAYGSFMTFVQAQTVEIENRQREMFSRFAPNRAARRAKK